MNVNDMVLVSVDDHVVEPPDVFEGRVAAKYRDHVPQFITNDDGTPDIITANQMVVPAGRQIDQSIDAPGACTRAGSGTWRKIEPVRTSFR